MEPEVYTREELESYAYKELVKLAKQHDVYLKKSSKKASLIHRLTGLFKQVVCDEKNEEILDLPSRPEENDSGSRRLTFNVEAGKVSSPMPLQHQSLMDQKQEEPTELPPLQEEIANENVNENVVESRRLTFNVESRPKKSSSPIPPFQHELNPGTGPVESPLPASSTSDLNNLEGDNKRRLTFISNHTQSPVVLRTGSKVSRQSSQRTNLGNTPYQPSPVSVTKLNNLEKEHDRRLTFTSKQTLSSKVHRRSQRSNLGTTPHRPSLSSLTKMTPIGKENRSLSSKLQSSYHKPHSVQKKPASKFATPNLVKKFIETTGGKSQLMKSTLVKPASSCKMPNFNEIHKRNFAKMESLADNKQRTARRALELFSPLTRKNTSGIPVPMQKKVFNESLTLARTKRETPLNATLPSGSRRNVLKDSVLNKGPAPNLEKTREKHGKIIQGVRTNKRFLLQMKFRENK